MCVAFEVVTGKPLHFNLRKKKLSKGILIEVRNIFKKK